MTRVRAHPVEVSALGERATPQRSLGVVGGTVVGAAGGGWGCSVHVFLSFPRSFGSLRFFWGGHVLFAIDEAAGKLAF